MSSTEVLYEVAQRIATITLNRPDRLNAYTASLGQALRAAMRRATDDPGVRVIVLTGAGRGFCAGADMDSLGAIGAGGDGAARAAAVPLQPFDAPSDADYHTAHAYFPAVPKPIIAAINGACAGLGLVLTLYLRHALRRGRREVHHRVRAPRPDRRARHQPGAAAAGRPSAALDLLISARKFGADEALRLGLVDRVIPADD